MTFGVSAATIAAYAAVAAAAVGAYSSYSQGKAQQKQANREADYQNQMAAYNSKVQENNAIAVRDQTAQKLDSQRRMVRLQQGKERASIAQSGLTASGSLLDVYDQNAVFSELDMLNTAYSGEMDARGLAAQSQITSWQGAQESSMSRMRGKNAARAGAMNAGSSILSGVSAAYGMSAKSSAPTTKAP